MKQSLKRYSAKRKSVNKKSLSKKYEYQMKGMGVLLSMYSSAISNLERDLKKIKINLNHIIIKYKHETNKQKKKELKSIIRQMKNDIANNKEKLCKLLSNISSTTSKALQSDKIKNKKGGGIIANLFKDVQKSAEDLSVAAKKTIEKESKAQGQEFSKLFKKL